MFRIRLRHTRARLIVIVILASVSIVFLTATAWALTLTTTLDPSGTITGNWTGGGTADGSCTGNCQRVDDGSTPDGDTSYVSSSAANVDEYSLPDTVGGQRATSIKLRVYMKRQTAESCFWNWGTPSTNLLQMNIRIGGTLQTQSNKTPTNNYAWYEQDYTGTWTQSQINSLQIWVSKSTTTGCILSATNATFRISAVQAVVSWTSPDLNQESSRVYLNTNNATPGTPIATSNTLSDVQHDTAFRVRMAVKPTVADWQTDAWGSHSNTYKLQYASKSASSCAAQASGWGDVSSGSGNIRWYNNPGVADGAAITAYANDPTVGGSLVHQTYRESNNFGLTNAVTTGNAALWDFSLQDVGSTPGDDYCLRVVKSDGNLLESYSNYAEVVAVGDYGVSIVNGSGVDVVGPQVTFPSIEVKTSCSVSNGTLGISSQKVRINNDILKNGWDVSIAPTNGPTDSWQSGGEEYDFNDSSGCTDGADADSLGGSLEVQASSSTVTPKSGCNNTGVSKGSNVSFVQPGVDAVSLVSASSSASRFCYWDVTGVGLEQLIPKATPIGNYSIDMTITMTAL